MFLCINFRPTGVRAELMTPRRMPPCITCSLTTNISSSCRNAPLSKCAMLFISDSTSPLHSVPVLNQEIHALPPPWQQTTIHSGANENLSMKCLLTFCLLQVECGLWKQSGEFLKSDIVWSRHFLLPPDQQQSYHVDISGLQLRNQSVISCKA